MVQSLQLQSQQSRGDFHHCVHLKDILPILSFLLFFVIVLGSIICTVEEKCIAQLKNRYNCERNAATII